MFVTVLYISFLCAIQLNYAAETQDLSSLKISASTSQQQFELVSGAKLSLFTFYDLVEAASGPCNGTCDVENTSHTERIDDEDCTVVVENGNPRMNVLIKTTVSKSFIGIWRCTLRTQSVSNPGAMSMQSAAFTILLSETRRSSELSKTLSGSLVSVHVPVSQTANVSLYAGMPTLELNIEGDYKNYLTYGCRTECHILPQTSVNSQTCRVQNAEKIMTVFDPKLLLYDGLWTCTTKLKPTEDPKSGKRVGHNWISNTVQLNISVKEPVGLSNEKIIIIAVAVSTIVLLIIVGQTMCILHFKKKAARIAIDKNLTLRNTINEGSSRDRYVNKKTGKQVSGKGTADDGIYEALESVRDLPPPLPPLATLPVTPRSHHLMRTTSQSSLNVSGTSTTPRMPRAHQNPGKYNTVARSSSLERIKKRPPQPLPTEPEIYEDVATEDKAAMRKHQLFGMKTSPGPHTGPTTAMGPNRPALGKPSGFPNRPELLKPPGSNVGRPPITNKFPASPKPMPSLPATSSAKPMGGMPILPSMISAANLKPVKKTQPKPPPPVTQRPRQPLTLIIPSTSANTRKPKLPTPVPEPIRKEPEPIPEDFESVVSDDSDDEFKCYDFLPDINIYENSANLRY